MRNLKAGDTVFVVQQMYRPKEGEKPVTFESVTVEKVGSKYGYIKLYSELVPFSLVNGESHHSGPYAGNVRANGQGFDVYRSKAAWVDSVNAIAEHKRLFRRIMRTSYRMIDLSPYAVECIHAVLDSEGVEQ